MKTIRTAASKNKDYQPNVDYNFSYGWTHHSKEFAIRLLIGSMLGFTTSVAMYGPQIEVVDAKTQEILDDEDSI